jgi:hypothetical protein
MTQSPFDQAPRPDESDPFFDAAARIAAQIVSIPGSAPRRASFLLLDGDVLNTVAEYDENGDVMGGRYRLVDFPNFASVVTGGELKVVRFSDDGAVCAPAIAVVTRYGFTSTAPRAAPRPRYRPAPWRRHHRDVGPTPGHNIHGHPACPAKPFLTGEVGAHQGIA